MTTHRRPRMTLLALLFLLLATLARADDYDDYPEALADTKSTTKAKVVSSIITQAKAAELANGDGDIAQDGKCQEFISLYCAKVTRGDSAIADCLRDRLDEEEAGDVNGRHISKDCKAEMDAFYIDRSKNINKDTRLAEACKEDAAKYCAASPLVNEGGVTMCLASRKSDLSAQCKAQVDRAVRDKAYDYRYDPALYAACDAEVKRVCVGIEPGQGRVISCLRDARSQLTWACQEQVFRQESEGDDDLRSSVRLFHACLQDKNTFCKSVEPGNNAAKECLEQHRNDDGFSNACRKELESLMTRRAQDFRLEDGLMNNCVDDMRELCGMTPEELYRVKDAKELAAAEKSVMNCLQDFRQDLRLHCRNEVTKVMKRASEDIRFDTSLAEACSSDRERLCPDIQAGSARVIRCLQDARDDLTQECSAAMFDFEVHMAESIDFNYPMKQSCSEEITKYCKDVAAGHGRVMRCLEDHLDDDGMGGDCRKEVERELQLSASDYRLNFKLKKACEDDIDAICGDVCNPFQSEACGGRVLRCLTDKRSSIQSDECKNEVFYYLKMAANDYRNDVLLAEACRKDVETFCARIRPGSGRVHRCLRDHHDSLSPACQVEEERMSIIESEDVRLRPQLMAACSDELVNYCKDVEYGKGRKFKCLQQNLDKTDFGAACRDEIKRRSDLMTSDYRYDATLATSCKEDIDKSCSAERDLPHGRASVLSCLVRQTGQGHVSDACSIEVSRAVRMALWAYHEGQALTAVCDADVAKYCELENLTKVSRFGIGKVGRCLAREVALASSMDAQCRSLVLAAAPSDVRDSVLSTTGGAEGMYAYLTSAQDYVTMSSLVNRQGRGMSVISLSGWVAVAGMFSMSAVIMLMLFSAYRKYRFAGLDYVVVKGSANVRRADD